MLCHIGGGAAISSFQELHIIYPHCSTLLVFTVIDKRTRFFSRFDTHYKVLYNMSFVNLPENHWTTTTGATGSAATSLSGSGANSCTIHDVGRSVLAVVVPTVEFSHVRYPQPSASILVFSHVCPSGKLANASKEDLEYLTDELPSFGIDVDRNIAHGKIERISNLFKSAYSRSLADRKSAMFEATLIKLRLFEVATADEADSEKRYKELDKQYAKLDEQYNNRFDREWRGTLASAQTIVDEQVEPDEGSII